MNESFALLSQFHFLRPWWLLGLLLLPVLVFLALRSTKNSSSWAQAINPKLLKYLLDDQGERAKKWPLYVFIAACVLCLLALAGPVWKKIPQPVNQPDDALVIVMDLSLSMLATDLKPSRLVAAQHKLTDLLKARKQGQTALVVYAGDAHIVTPLTDDTGTIIAMVSALSPLIMPALGSRVTMGIKMANQALNNGGIKKGRILLMTDGIQDKDIKSISEQLKNTQHQLSILMIGTADGGPIPIPQQGYLRDKGEIVIAQTDMSMLKKLATKTAAPIARLSLDDSDLNRLIPSHRFNLNKSTHQVDREMVQWYEQGPWLVLLILPFAALGFRRGWLLSLLFIVLIQPAPVEAADWSDQLWQTANQQGVKAFAEKDYQAAGKLFTSPAWQGSSAYKKGDFKAAVDYFYKLNSAQANYNRGNALANMGQLEQAIDAYDEALKRDPNFTDAEANKELVENLKKQQQQQQESDSQDSKQNSQQQSQNQQQQQKSSDGQQSQDQSSQDQSTQDQQQSSNNSNSTDQKTNGNQSEANPQDDAEKEQQKQADADQQKDDDSAVQNEQAVSKAQQLNDEEQQAMEQWLRRIPDEPGALLRRKFNYQYQLNRQNNQFIPQQDNEAIW